MSKMKIRKEVMWFAEQMEKKLRSHDYDRGKRGWVEDSPLRLLCELSKEREELRTEVVRCSTMNFKWHPTIDLNPVIEETADVANFAMMVADLARISLEKRQRRNVKCQDEK